LTDTGGKLSESWRVDAVIYNPYGHIEKTYPPLAARLSVLFWVIRWASCRCTKSRAKKSPHKAGKGSQSVV